MTRRSWWAGCCGVALVLLLPAAQEQGPGRARRAVHQHDFDVQHYRIQLHFDQAARAFKGVTDIRLRPLRHGFDTVVLDAETFRVTAAGPLRFVQTPGQVTLQLERPYRAGEEVNVTVAYEATQVAIDPTQYGMPAGYGLGLTFRPATASHPRLLYTLSFPEGARHWFPGNDHPNDKATHEIIATVDAGEQVIANGVLRNVTEDPARHEKTFHWVQDRPHSTYLYMLAAGPYVAVKDTRGALPVSYWVYPRVPETEALRTFGRTREIIGFLQQEVGYPFPWAKYDQITIPDFRGGAESTSATVIGDNALHDSRAEQDFPSAWLVAHEAAHQWWGDLVTMRDWSHTWLHESFATFYEHLYLAHLLGPEAGAWDLQTRKRAYFAEARQKHMRPIVDDRWQWPNENFDRHTYQKGGAVLAMLRAQMGVEAYRRAVTYYLRKHAYGSVTTRDFQNAIREATGQSLDWFFDQWIFRAGHPVLTVTQEWHAGILRLTVVQQQPDLYRLPVAIGVTTRAGHKRVQSIVVRQREETFLLPSAERPHLVHFDEGDMLLKELTFVKPTEELLYQLQNDTVLGRWDAATALQQRRSEPGVVSALRSAAVQDAFWAVRREALLPNDRDFLQARAVADPSSAVRVGALAALRQLRDPGLANFFVERFRREDSYLAQAEAVRALGALHAAPAVLQEAAAMPSPNDVIAVAARESLASATSGATP